MFKNAVQLEIKIAEKVYHLICDHDSPIAHVKEAIFQMTKIVADIEQKISESAKVEEKPSSAPQEEKPE